MGEGESRLGLLQKLLQKLKQIEVPQIIRRLDQCRPGLVIDLRGLLGHCHLSHTITHTFFALPIPLKLYDLSPPFQKVMDILIATHREIFVNLGLRYLSDLNQDVEILREELQKLDIGIKHVTKTHEAAQRNAAVPTSTAMEWLSGAVSLSRNAHDLLREAQELATRSCQPKISRSCYKMGKRLAVMKERVLQRCNRSFDNVSFLAGPAITEPTLLTEGQNNMFSNVWNILKKQEPTVIGIFGMGGIGKTTILRKVHDDLLQMDDHDDIDVVIFCKVCRVPNVNKIQDRIRMELGISDQLWKNKSSNERTKDIFSILSQKKFVLLLDDIWEGFDLRQVGVPVPQEHQTNSKVVLTARSVHACASMDSSFSTKFSIEALPENEAWKLFSVAAGEDIVNSSPEITKLAKDMVRQCSGLPLAIVTAARVLARRGTDASRWLNDLSVIRDKSLWNRTVSPDLISANPTPASPANKDVVSILELSYDLLEDEVRKSCFKYCSLLPFVDRDQLIAYWIGEGILGEFEDGNDARDLGYTIIESLEKDGLLMGEGRAVRMHDVVREVASSIAKEEGEKFLVQAGAYLTEAPAVDEWKEAHRVSLTYNGIEELPTSPSCHTLSTLILTKCGLRTLSRDFFKSMPSLKVLDLSWCEMDEVPATIACLENLQYLNLSHTSITALPVEFKRLSRLQVLLLNNTAELNTIPQGMIAGFLSLQELNMFHSGNEVWIAEAEQVVVGSEVFIAELKCLKKLNHLGISIKDVQGMKKLECSHDIQLCTDSLLIMRCKGLSCFKLSSIVFMVRLRMLEIYDCADLLEIQIMDQFIFDGHFYGLQHVHIEGCWSLKELTCLSLAPNLQILHIHRCMKLKFVIGTQGETGRASYSDTFPRLTQMCLANLPNLNSICSGAISSSVLTEIRVSYCPKLKQLPIDCARIPKTFKLIEGQGNWWNSLEWKDDNNKKILLPYFREIQY